MINKRQPAAATVFAVLMLFSAVLGSAASAQLQGWYDGFESYPAGTWKLPVNQWYHGGGASAIAIDTSTAVAGKQSLKLTGSLGGCYAALVSRKVDPVGTTLPADFVLTCAFRCGNQKLSGCAPYRQIISLRQGATWNFKTSHQPFIVHQNGQLRLADNKFYGSPVALLTWHWLQMRYTRLSSSQVRFVYYLNGQFLASITTAAATNETLANWVELACHEGDGWYDDVTISDAGIVSTRANGTVSYQIAATGCAGRPYQVGTSFGTGPTPISTGRALRVSLDVLIRVSVGNLLPTVFQNYSGSLSTSGQALQPPKFDIPNEPAWKGITIHTAFVVIDPKVPSGIRAISNTDSRRL